jgi:hypothetical protein
VRSRSLVGHPAAKLAAGGDLQPGDILVVSARSPVMLALTWFVRLFKRGVRKYAHWNHIAVYHHTDDAGIQWAVEAAPGGVAWRKVSELGRVMTNADQPKTDEQRTIVATGVASMLKLAYDWTAIEADAFAQIASSGVTWSMEWDGARPPVHVICSSLASYWQWQAKLAGPHSWKTTPMEWAMFVASRGWTSQPAATGVH